MTPCRHPSEDLISSFAAGRLRPGAALVVRAHLFHCSECREEVGFFESVGGALLERESRSEMAPDALERALTVLDELSPTTASAPRAADSSSPSALDGIVFGKRRWIAPGVWVTRAESERRSRELIYLLRIGPGMVLPRHTHAGSEFTCVLEGSFSDDAGDYALGDFVATDEAVVHSPVVARDAPCTCLISTDAPLVMRDVLGRIFQPFAGI